MEAITLRELIAAVDGTLMGDVTDLELTIDRVDHDTRNLHPGSVYLALIGESKDGHSYINDALSKGCAGCIYSRERDSYQPGKFYVKVKNTTRALRDLAAWYKSRYPIPFIGVTGSVGKTTAKEMIAAVLGEKYKVHKTPENKNNEIGLPFALLELDSTHQISVCEMGMNHFGEIDYLAELVRPSVAVITNIGDSHIEFLGSRENILKAKCEIFPHMAPDSLAVLNGDDELLATLAHTLEMPIAWCGSDQSLDYAASDLERELTGELHCTVTTPKGSREMDIPALGSHMIYPVLMAAAVGERFGLTLDEIANGVLHYAPAKMRMDIIRREDGFCILNDAYNASPQSMRAAVEVLAGTKSDYKIAVLGDMFELGALAVPLHAGVGEFLGKSGISCLVAVGELARHIYNAAETAQVPEVYWFASKEEAMPLLESLARPNATMLVKASRGMMFESIVERLKEQRKPGEE